MTDSILNNVKKNLGIDASYTEFDEDVITHINSVFSILHQLGVGPDAGFYITGTTELWSTYLTGTTLLNAVKTYMYLRVRVLFDPPTTSYQIDAMNRQIDELGWRLNVAREETEWVDPTT